MECVIKPRSLLAAAICITAALPVLAEEPLAGGITDMFTQGSVGVNFRYRYEYVDQDGFNDEAKASTLLSKVTYTSAPYAGFAFLVEGTNVHFVGPDDFNSTDNGKTQYPVVPDPEGTEVNQAWLKYSWQETSGTYGRQVINYGNQRFVGGVAWRQNEQTFDAFRAQAATAFGLSLDYTYAYKVNRIFGPDDNMAQPSQWSGNNNFLRVEYRLLENHAVAGFAYLLDIDDRTGWSPNLSVNNSSDTYGARYDGRFGPVAVRAAYASQSNAGNSSLDYDADYYMIESEAAFFGVTGTLCYEVLGSDNGVGFKTPLATLHKFQGWADKFLVTPADGIEDLYIGVSGVVGPVNLAATWHDFQAEKGSDDFGSEIDLAATWPVSKMWNLQLKYANFNTDDKALYQDTQKVWLTVQLKI